MQVCLIIFLVTIPVHTWKGLAASGSAKGLLSKFDIIPTYDNIIKICNWALINK